MANAVASYLQRTSFMLCLLALVGVLALLWFGKIPGASADFLVPAILGVYVTGESAKKISAHRAASADPNANTESVILALEGKAANGASPAPSEVP
jgi:hypothetical protein